MLGYYKPKEQGPWLDEGCSELSDRRKQVKLQRLQDPSQTKWGNLNNVGPEASRYFRNKKREYLKDKPSELEMNSKNKNVRDLYTGIYKFKSGYQPRSNLV
jgi:hypothetical protein